MSRFLRPLWIALALLLLFQEWFWTKAGVLARALAALLPVEALRRAIERLVAALPAPLVLLLFSIPAAALFPIKLAALWFFAGGHVLLGASMFVLAKIVGVGIGAFLFDICRPKLLSMPLFARAYAWLLRALDWAHGLLAPVKARARAVWREAKARILAQWPRGRFARRLQLLRARLRRP